MSVRKSTPPAELEGARRAPQPFVSLSRRSEIVSNLAARAAHTPPATRPEVIAGLPIPTETDDQAEDFATRRQGSERMKTP